ncbi:MAG: KpsF/GutQ family sugar-phosphate isomerase [Calditrichaeota bacterium]|nr:KpsF/GutQ family sugar-phosphate isomerase [Calditrichota bacterium]MCB9392024.1 KpsF/GutQ family sugar-phosphate isomerase [Calditrichota bacterium]
MADNLQNAMTAARRLLQIEADAVRELVSRLDGEFQQAVQLLMGIRGRVIVTGIGKSGHIGRKISSTLASTGTPSSFLHPVEAAHGDLGMIARDDAALIVSKSGDSEELWAVLPYLKLTSIPIVGLLGNPNGALAAKCDVVLDCSVAEEGCPMNLAPTSSSTAALAMGDALAVALLTAKEFSAEDFAYLHPGGSLGRRLLLRVEDVMHSGDKMPVVQETDDLKSAVLCMSERRLGAVCLVNQQGILTGIFTDGDLRRAWQEDAQLSGSRVGELATRNPKTVQRDELVTTAVNLMERHNIMVLPVTESSGRLAGVVHMHDLLKSGIGRS